MHRCEKCEELQEEVRQLRVAISGLDDEKLAHFMEFREKFGLTRAEYNIFIILYERFNQCVARSRLEYANGPIKSDYPDVANLLKVRLSRIRKKVAGHFVITNRWNEGYKLEPAPILDDARSPETVG